MDNERINLYVRGGGDDEANEDIWDDELLIKAYDKAVNETKADIAKAMQAKANERRKSRGNSKWTVGDFCRSTYSVDEEEYEAIIVKMVSKTKCIVKYCGYGNEELVDISQLKPSLGADAQIYQVQVAACKQTRRDQHGRIQDEHPSTSHAGNIPNIPNVPQFSSVTPFPPPLPPNFLESMNSHDESDALSAMLMSWYMSGYHTGYFHCMKQMSNRNANA